MVKFKYILLLIFIALVIKVLWGYYGFQSIENYDKKNVLLALGQYPPEEVKSFEKLIPLHRYKQPPQRGDWLDVVAEEGQTFQEFVESNPQKSAKDKNKIYITIIGKLSDKHADIVKKTAKYIEAFFGLPVAYTEPVSLDSIPQEYKRINFLTRNPQLLTTYIIEDILNPNMPEDAYANIALTAVDLWPGKGWNFVFGQADSEARTGVWSLARNGDPYKDYKSYTICLRRTISTAIHEISHMFGMHHCIYFECNLNGSNSRKESDSHPLWLCPICLRKLHWVINEPIEDRFKRLIKVCHKNNFIIEKSFYEKSLKALEN